jgi:DNA-binding response OmpR family regulator
MHVLIVEDEKKMAELLKKGLEEENHSVELAFDGREGLEMAEGLEFDAIVLDLMLPIIDGFTVARQLRKNGKTTPIFSSHRPRYRTGCCERTRHRSR